MTIDELIKLNNSSLDDIHNLELDNISDEYQKTEGFPTYDITRGFAFGLLKLHMMIEEVRLKQDVDNLTGEELERFTFQRKGVERRTATYAQGSITVLNGNGTVTIGDVFESESGLKYASDITADVTVGSVIPVTCLTAGTEGNVAVNTITKMPVTIAGINQITNQEVFVGGRDAENDDDLRNRYYEALREPATSGNEAHYKKWAKEITGVGEAKAIGERFGQNTVEIVIVDSDRQPASADLVAKVQEYIDPNGKGHGEGVAPTGAYCTVVSAAAVPINVKVTGAKLDESTSANMVANDIKEKLVEYLKTIALKQDYVSWAQIGAYIISASGLLDYDTYTVNGAVSQVKINDEQVAVIGTVEVVV